MYPKTKEQFEADCEYAQDLAKRTGSKWMVEYEGIQYYFDRTGASRSI